MIALRAAYRDGLLARRHWLPNILSGVIVGVVALPLAMAFAIASGAKPEQGLYTAIIAGLCVSVFGGSRLQIAGPTGAFIVILAGITAKHGTDGLQMATLLGGIILLVFGLVRMGAIIKFIPHPVIVGFTSGIAIIIWVGQWRDFLGLPPVAGEHFHDRTLHLLRAMPGFHSTTAAIALASLIVLVLVPRMRSMQRVPAPLVALVAATLAQSLFHFDGVRTLGSAFGGIPEGLPTFRLPAISFDSVVELIGPAFTIAMLGAIESLLSAVVADGMAGTRHDSNQELIGQGLANIVSPLFGGIAATGAIARTATNVRNGGTGPLAGIVHALVLALILVLLAPLAANVPLAALSAILFVVAWNMSDAAHFVKLVRSAPRADVVILIVTFILTILVDLVVAVNIGVILAMLQFLRRMASSVEVKTAPEASLASELSLAGLERMPSGVAVYSVDGPFFFGAVETFERALADTHTDPRVLVIWLRWVPFIDSTGLKTLEEALRDFRRREVTVLLAGANARVEGKMARAGLVTLAGPDNVVETLHVALRRAEALCRARVRPA